MGVPVDFAFERRVKDSEDHHRCIKTKAWQKAVFNGS